MCGICGQINFNGEPADVEAVVRMTDAMTPRGPDALGLTVHANVALGHRRLKIIDLSERARQPMEDNALGYTIVYNGAIYNYNELRKRLEAKGYQFFSYGDTEVILKAYHAWGVDCVRHFNGMFAFAIVHRDSGEVFLALAKDHGIHVIRDVFRYYRSDSASAIEAGNDTRTALVGYGVDGSHGYERTHVASLKAVADLTILFIQSPPTFSRDKKGLSSLNGFPHQPERRVIKIET